MSDMMNLPDLFTHSILSQKIEEKNVVFDKTLKEEKEEEKEEDFSLTLDVPIPSPRELRPYQIEAVEEVYKSWEQGIFRPIIVLPTGTGKSTVIAKIACDQRKNNKKVLLLAHRVELLRQMSSSVVAVDPEGEVPGIFSGKYKNYSTDIVAASFDSLRNEKSLRLLGRRDVILVDEVHHSTAETYKNTLEKYGVCTEGTTLAAGFTATAMRSEGKSLSHIWDSIVYEHTIDWAIQEGFLVPPTGVTVKLEELDGLSRLKSNRGDFQITELNDLMHQASTAVVDAIKDKAFGKKMIIFATTVENGEELEAKLVESGFKVRTLFGFHADEYRLEVYDLFHRGELDGLITVQVLTEGADFPRCDCVVMARPTRSQVLYIQMVGRALRPFTDPLTGVEKKEALVLDLVGTARDKSLIVAGDLYGLGDKEDKEEDEEEDDEKEELDDEEKIPQSAKLGSNEPIELEEIDLLRKVTVVSPFPHDMIIGPDRVMWIQVTPQIIITPIRENNQGYYMLKDSTQVNDKGAILFNLFIIPTRSNKGAKIQGYTTQVEGKNELTVQTFEEWINTLTKIIPPTHKSKYNPRQFKIQATDKQISAAAKMKVKPLDYTRGGHLIALTRAFFKWDLRVAEEGH